MPKTKAPISIPRSEFMKDSAKWVKRAQLGVVKVLDDKDGHVRSTISSPYHHTQRVEHKYIWHVDEERELSKLRDRLCDMYLKDKSESTRTAIEFLEQYASSCMYNLDNYSDREDGKIVQNGEELIYEIYKEKDDE